MKLGTILNKRKFLVQVEIDAENFKIIEAVSAGQAAMDYVRELNEAGDIWAYGVEPHTVLVWELKGSPVAIDVTCKVKHVEYTAKPRVLDV